MILCTLNDKISPQMIRLLREFMNLTKPLPNYIIYNKNTGKCRWAVFDTEDDTSEYTTTIDDESDIIYTIDEFNKRVIKENMDVDMPAEEYDTKALGA